MRVLNKTKRCVIASQAELADSFLSRLKGLLGRSSLASEQALIITQCNSIHMFFMKFPIDAIFVDKNDRVVGMVKAIKPFALSPIFFKSVYVVELAVGGVEKSRTEVGDILQLD